MKLTHQRSHRRRFGVATLFVSACLAAGIHATANAQTAAKKVLSVDDYTQWRAINGPSISGDGKWVTYVLSQTNTAPADAKPVLHLLRLERRTRTLEVAERLGAGVLVRLAVDRVSDRSRRPAAAAVAVDAAAAQRRPAAPRRRSGTRGGQGTPPAPPRRVELRNLATGAVQSWQDMQSFTFAATSSHLILRRRAPGGAARCRRSRCGWRRRRRAGRQRPADDARRGPRGADVIVHDLATGHDQLLGSVGEISFNKKGDLLAYTVDATPRDGNGLFVLDLRDGRVNPLDNDARVYSRLTWNDGGNGTRRAQGRGRRQDARARQHAARLSRTCRPRSTKPRARRRSSSIRPRPPDFPKGFVRERSRRDRVERRQASASSSASRSRSPRPIRPRGAAAPTRVADVDVWNTKDERIQSRADDSRRRRSEFHVSRSVRRRRPRSSCKLADSTMREVDVEPGRTLGRGSRHSRLHLRLQASGRGHLSRQHVHR